METSCPRCQRKYTLSDDMAGRRARCKNSTCQHVFRIPARSEEPTGTANQLTQIPQMGVNGQIVSPSAGVPNTLPAGMSPMPDADKAPAPADDPWAFLSEPSAPRAR